jgi:DMSO/TMAO reductase YedYZ molybdopterin-dependent catalytic subunit
MSGSSSDSDSRRVVALAGVLATGVALGVSELLAAVVPGAASPVSLVGERFIDVVPAPVKDAAIALFGVNDKLALVVGILAVSVAVGACLGVLAARRFPAALFGFGAFALIGVLAAALDPQALAVAVLVAVVGGALCGVAVLAKLVGAAAAMTTGRPDASAAERADASALDRRAFGRLAFFAAAAALLSGGGGRLLDARSRLAAARAAIALPGTRRDLPPVPAGASLDVAGITPLVTPNDEFYRIDTALTVPRVNVETWHLTVDGMVDRSLQITYEELLRMPLVEADVTLACVSNEIGGNLIGNARWLGVPLSALLEQAGVHPAATQVVGRSVDGWTGGFPTAVARDGRQALVAVGMNGEPLPLQHGFPARLVVPGLYGYVSATKWLAQIELTTWEGFDGYWVPRGWAKDGPVRTASRIDVPGHGRSIPPGPTAVAGVAWAQHTGIEGVELRVDAGDWQPARLADELHVDTWRQWVYEWDATAGSHELEVRATDRGGYTQTGERRPVAPDGATGWHRVRVTVADA